MNPPHFFLKSRDIWQQANIEYENLFKLSSQTQNKSYN